MTPVNTQDEERERLAQLAIDCGIDPVAESAFLAAMTDAQQSQDVREQLARFIEERTDHQVWDEYSLAGDLLANFTLTPKPEGASPCPHNGNPNCTWNPFTKPPQKTGKCLIDCPVKPEGADRLPKGQEWQPISTAPRDGTNVLLFTTCHGVVQAWFSEGYWSEDTPISPRDYSGDVWVCADDAFQIECDFDGKEWHHGTATHWKLLPAPPSADTVMK